MTDVEHHDATDNTSTEQSKEPSVFPITKLMTIS